MIEFNLTEENKQFKLNSNGAFIQLLYLHTIAVGWSRINEYEIRITQTRAVTLNIKSSQEKKPNRTDLSSFT